MKRGQKTLTKDKRVCCRGARLRALEHSMIKSGRAKDEEQKSQRLPLKHARVLCRARALAVGAFFVDKSFDSADVELFLPELPRSFSIVLLC